LIGQPVTFLRWLAAGEFNGEILVVFNNWSARFFAHGLISSRLLPGVARAIIAPLGVERNTERELEPRLARESLNSRRLALDLPGTLMVH
jgi:hypothetical protein